jgi:hypothetical protein
VLFCGGPALGLYGVRASQTLLASRVNTGIVPRGGTFHADDSILRYFFPLPLLSLPLPESRREFSGPANSRYILDRGPSRSLATMARAGLAELAITKLAILTTFDVFGR